MTKDVLHRSCSQLRCLQTTWMGVPAHGCGGLYGKWLWQLDATHLHRQLVDLYALPLLHMYSLFVYQTCLKV
jgi:hypothetical protein